LIIDKPALNVSYARSVSQTKYPENAQDIATRLASLIFAIASVASAQLAATKKDIPTIAKSARGAIVTIVMADGDKLIARGTRLFFL
jgi:hypothetical protein